MGARNLPRSLIKLFCEGKIKGYYPEYRTKACSYQEFAAHFALASKQPPHVGDAFVEVPLPASFCSNKDDPSVEPFGYIMEVLEEKSGSSKKTGQNKTGFIRLIYLMDNGGKAVELPGVIFSMEDLAKVSQLDVAIPHPADDESSISVKEYFENRMYTATKL